MQRKARLFVGSSVEGLDIADAVNSNLDHSIDVTIWRNNTFNLSSTAVDSLLSKSKSVDYALFVFSPDDIAIIKAEKKVVVRDNVLFELGLFIGALGKDRCFILKPRGVDLHFPTDLLGIIPADYEPDRSDGDLPSAVNHACTKIKGQIAKLGLMQELANPQPLTRIRPSASQKVDSYDVALLTELLTTLTESPDGKTISEIKRRTKQSGPRIDLSAIRLEREGYVERHVSNDQNGYDYFSYTITDQGVEVLLASAEKITLPTNDEDPFPDGDIPF